MIKIGLFSLQIMEKMLDRGKVIKGLKKKISKQAKLTGLKYHTEGEKEGLFKVFVKMYFNKVKHILGFDQCTQYFTGAAPIEKKVSWMCSAASVHLCL